MLRSLNTIAADPRDTRVKSASCLLLGYLNEYLLTENDSSFFSLCCCAWPIGPITSFILCPPVIFQPQRWIPALLGAYELDFYSQVSYHVRRTTDSWRICRNGEILGHTGSCHFFLFSEELSSWSGQHTDVSKLHVHKNSRSLSRSFFSFKDFINWAVLFVGSIGYAYAKRYSWLLAIACT